MTGFGRTGDSYFVSYRDPNLENTIEVFEQAAEYIENGYMRQGHGCLPAALKEARPFPSAYPHSSDLSDKETGYRPFIRRRKDRSFL